MSEAEEREEAVFEAALKLSPAERPGYLDRTCGSDVELRRRVAVLLSALERAGSFMKEPATPERTARISFPPTEKPGDWIGRYKLLEQIGEGGCGIVYVAEQEEPVRRRVALKVIKVGMDTKQVIARFDAERQALAMMDHPNIAKIHDAGATDAGRPFFVMELVRGIKITEFCDENKLSTHERLKVFMQVCQAIQHAHQKGIIHRDIKPSNVVVSINDGVPVPKVIDFGIAKATQGRLTEQTVYTAFEQFIGTPAYMSPEQALMTSLDIDTRSDVYSLGVLLYELLTGKPPFDPKELLAAGLDEMRRMIRETEPARPSTCLSRMAADALTTTAKRRRTEAPKLLWQVGGDLDWIVMKCLEKERARRYETANGLAGDLQRYLNNEPVAARPPSRLYEFQKTVRRHKFGFAATAAVILALAGGVLASTWQAVRARKASQQSEEMSRFLKDDLLTQATPDADAPPETRKAMEEVLKKAVQKLEGNPNMARQPELEASLRLAIGSTYNKLGLATEAEPHLRRSVELRRSALGMEHPDTLAAEQELAMLLWAGLMKFEEAETLSRRTWQTRERVLGLDHRDTLMSLTCYYSVLADQRKFAEAEPLARQVLQIRERLFGPYDFDTINAYGDLAYVLFNQGEFAKGERYAREELERFKGHGFGDKPNAFFSQNNLAFFHFVRGNVKEAEKLLLEERPRAISIFGPESPVTLQVQHLLARVLAEQNRLDNAEALASETLAARRRVSPGQESLGRTLLVLGNVLIQKSKFEEAEPLLREALTLFREHYPRKPELAAQAANALGAIAAERRDYPAAEKLFLSNPDSLLLPVAGMSLKEQRTTIGRIIQLYQNWGKVEQANRWQQKLDAISRTQAHAASASL
jgi:serine/threonine protein kinase